MNNCAVKFILNYDYSITQDVFNKAKSILNWRFDENFNVNLIDTDVEYQVKDVSDLAKNEIEEIADSFFSFTFDNAHNAPLYKLLVLKNNDETMILANINSLIFDYTSINDFYELFDDLNKTSPKHDLNHYYKNVNDYLNSSDFKKDCDYWADYILNSSDYINFYNLKKNAYKSQIINSDKDSVSNFIKNNDCSLFDFYGSIFSLYLSRIDRVDGCLLKTIIPGKKSDLKSFDRNTLLKIGVNNHDSFKDLLSEFNSSFRNVLNHTPIDVDNYLDENVTYYSIYDFNDLNKNIQVHTGDDSALTLNIYGNSLELVYNCDLFSDTYVEHMAKNIESLINNVLNSPGQCICDIDILSKEEKDLLSDFCKGKTIEVEKDKMFSEAFRQHATNNPESIAVDDGVDKITYGELEKSTNSIANDLYNNHDIGPGSRVALMLPRNYHFPEFVLALNKIGAAFVPIDLLFPANRIGHMLAIAGAEHLITTKAIAQNLDLTTNIIHIDDLDYDTDVEVEILSKKDDLFAILFTSGTTGIPKGVMFHNRQFPWFGAAFIDIFNFSPGEVVGCYFSFSFVASFVICVSLYLGGNVRLFNENEQKNSLLLLKTLKESHMNSLILPPTVGIPIFENEDLNLDYLVLAGAKLNELSKKDRKTKLVNFYGTTEVIFAISKIYDLNDIEDDRVPIGRPVANTWTYILDENGNQMPIGVPGEICISSAGITQGYCNDPQTTSEVYVENPFCNSEINKRMYLTGDIGFYNFDGEIEIIGRDDEQLSVRGFRVESKEILSIMKGFEEISDIYLDVDYDNLIAYYTTSVDLDIDEVKEALKNELPYYMIPSLFIELEKIPLNINGKIDKSSLKVVTNDEDIEITDDIIACVVDAFKEILNQDVVLIDDDFVSLGGNSLSAMKLQLLLKERLGVYLSSNELIDLSTPNDIANHIKFNLNVHSTVDEDKYTFDELCSLSESQLNVYLDESVNDMGTAYNNSFKIDFHENYSIEEIKDALIKLFEVFPILKARVLNKEGELSFIFDSEPEIAEGTLNDIDSFVRPFESDKYLSRFLIVQDNSSISLCADFHHLIFDGTSMNILLNKLSSILNKETVDFVDKGVLRQKSFEEIIDSDYMDSAQEFFDEMLADRDEVHELLPSINGKADELIDTFDIDMEHLSSFLKNHSITHNQLFTSVFAYALSRYTGSDKVLFNIIENGRGHIDLTESVGMFVKTLPVLIDCKNQDIDSYLKYSSNLINSVMKYDLYPFRVLASQYDLNSNILFQYSHDLFSEVVNKENLKYSIDELKHDSTSDLSFFILNNGKDKLSIRTVYSSQFSKSFIEQFIQTYKLILNEMIRVDNLKDINYITDKDIEILDSYNQTEHNLLYEDILDAFNDNLSKYPDNKLVSINDNDYSYAEGAFIADKIAEQLIECDVNPGDCVGFLTERSEHYMFSILGILSAGCIYVPLDDEYPDERISFILKDTGSKVIIVSDETYERAKELTGKNTTILNISNILKGNVGCLSSLHVTYNDLAGILYTSGTTGIPKGVKITRNAILNVAAYYCDAYGLNNDDVYAMYPSIGFDAGCESLFKAIYAGACLSIVPKEVRHNMTELNNYFINQNVTHTMITTQVGKLFMQIIQNTSLKYLFVGGEKLGDVPSPENFQLVDEYGPTEGNNFISSINNSDKIDYSSVGFLNYNSKAYILDSEKRRVPCGAVGELYISGNQIADGYLNREKETGHSFVNNPFSNDDNYNIIYRTGDIARLLPDGSLAIIGRRDGQVKIRGNRVELSEIESVIRELDYVEDVTIQTIKNNDNNELVAYVVVSNVTEDDALKENIKNYVGKHKPNYMIPSFVINLDEIPLNVNGKVDKRALPSVDLSSLHADYVAPTTEDEKVIVEAFEKVFDDKIGIYDDFIHLGGDSLTAIKLVSYLEGYNITVADILSLHTPHALAQNIKRVEFDLDIYTLESGCPLNESQLNVYLDMMVNDKYDAYLTPFFMEISKEYEINEIHSALNKIFDAHPILSMCISDEFEVPYLVKGSQPQIIVEDDVSNDFIIEFINKPFDLQDSLCRFIILDNDNDNYKLFAAFNHIIFDALSRNVFKRDLQSILDGESVDIDDSFLKVSAFSQQIQNTDEYSEAKNFYESMLADNEESHTLIESVDADEQGNSKFDLDLDITSLKSFLGKYEVSENVLFTSAFAYTLSRFTGHENAAFNIIENGRDRFNNFNSIGMYVNTLPILTNCKNQSISSFIKHMASLIYNVMRYNYYPFRLLANKYDINSDILFQFLPEWIDTVVADKNISNANANEIIADRENLTCDLSVEVIQKGNEYNLDIRYSDKYSNTFVERFAESYKLILHQLISVDKLEEINYITNEDIEILKTINQKEHPLTYNDILDAFNDSLSKYPDNKLVSFNDRNYSYAEGAFIADKIAKQLIEFGVNSGDCVGFLTERSENYMFSILGILSAGAIYVPLDDAHPDERIEFMLEDTASKAVIVDDFTLERVKSFNNNAAILNISDILKEDLGSLSDLPIVYGDLASILYTSGTTGIPKGVKITRKSIVNYIQYYADKFGIGPDDVFALYAAIGFDVGAIKSIFAPIYSGACLNVIPYEVRLDMDKLNNHFIKHNVTHTHIPTQIAKLFISDVENSSLDVLLTGGEKLGEVEYTSDFLFVDSYGPTEACVSVTSIEEEKRIHHSSIGFPHINTKVYVLDDELRQVPIGAVGELYLAGYQIADGYLNRDEETANAFLDNPFDDDENYNVIYRTGDMVRVLPDSSLSIIGRRDSQVKIRGNRVELTEIESIIRELDYVEDLTVQTIKNNNNNELVAYVVVSRDISEDNLRDLICDYVSKHKPDYMVPSFVMKLDNIPVNVNGKVNKRALPDVDVSSLHAEYVAPTNETEKHIVDAFELVFNQKGLGLNDDFIRLGGDSITAIRVISLLEKDDISCSARDILNYKTPYLIAQNVEKITKISYNATEGEVDLLPIQSYFFDQNKSNNFSQEYILKSKVNLDLDTLQNAFNQLTNIHDMLRATYRYDENKVIQEILPLDSCICEIKEYDCDDLNNCLRNIIEKSKESLDITDGLVKVRLVHHGDECYLIFVIHHLIIDGISWSILLDDLTYIYNQLENNKEINILRPYPYKSWVEDVKSLADNISNDEKQHWMKVNRLLDDSTIRGKSKGFTFNADASFDINNLLMLSEEEYLALSIARAYKNTFGEDIIFNHESYGRDDSLGDVNRTIGWFTSHFPVIVDVDKEYDAISLMNDVYKVKDAFKNVEHLGLNYGSLIYTSHELEYKHCPVTFNFLSTEFTFKNELFESVNQQIYSGDEIELFDLDSDSFGITFNVVRQGNSYNIVGNYADNTYISDKFNTFIENIKFELEFIGNFNFKDNNIVCCLSESQLGVYLDEKVNEKGSAYSNPRMIQCDSNYSIDEIENAIHKLIDKHPILRARVLDTDNIPLLVCDSYPTIEIKDKEDYSNLNRPFDLEKSLARFSIVSNEEGKFIFHSIHHIITDATSSTITNKELEQALMGKLDDTIDLGFVYASHDSFETQYGSKYKSAQKFFHDQFADIDEVQYLLRDVDGKKGSVSLPIRGIRENVELFTRKHSITTNNLLNAVFAYTYSRFTGSDKVYYNFTEHGRRENYSQNALGMFIRTIPFITNCENMSISDFVANMSDSILKSMTNSSYPFRLVAKEFNLSNNVIFEYNYDLNEFEIGKDMVVRDYADEVAEFLCVVNDSEDGFIVTVSHLDKFSQNTAIQFVKAFKEILIQILEKENLEDINYISNEDIELLDTYNQTEHPLAHNDVLDAFNDNLSKHPKNNLVTYNNNVYSYEEGAFIADAISNNLKTMNVEKNENVAFLVERSELYMFSVLGILSAGAVYVPLDDTHPDERIMFMLQDTDAKAIIVSDETYERAKSLTNNINILNISDIVKEDIGTLSALDVIYGDLACILYTSGTTGVPKGVKITRKSIINVAESYIKTYGLDKSDVYGLFSAIGFDVSSFVISVVMCAGACLSVIPEEIRFDMSELNKYFMKQNVTHAFITTQVGKLFMQSVDETSLDVLLVAGEKLGEFESPKDYRLIDAYGPTEAFAFVSSIDNGNKLNGSSVGMPNYNTKAYILDNQHRRVPCGAIGELYLSGFQVADGYLNRPEENANSFIDNKFDNDEKYGTLYATGDIVRLLPDGSIGIVGRRDSQVKIRGNRVELSEIESVIREIDYVEDITVQTIKHDTNNEVVAYVVVNNDLNGNELKDSVCDYVHEHKPEYMVPSYVIKLDSIPLNVNGKVDKRALPDVDRTTLHAEYVAPRNENEKEIVEAFEKALNLENISIYDDFIHLGGDSLTAIKLLSYIKSNDITMADIFTFRTPEAIAKNMPDFSFDLDLYSLESGCPLNSAQINVFADVTVYNKVNAYHIPGYIPISKEYSLEKILNSLDELLMVHPILGMHISNFYETNDTNVSNLDLLKDLMKTAKKFGIKDIMSLINAYGLKNIRGLYNMLRTIIRLFKGEYPYLIKGAKPPISVKSTLDKKIIIDFFSEPLNLHNNLSKFMIVESEDTYYLFYMIHHIIFDAISAGVFKHDFKILLNGGSVELDDTFLKSSAFTHQIKSTDKFDEASEFYYPILSDLSDVGILPEDSQSTGYTRSIYDLNFDKIAFKSFLKNAGISENVLFTSVFAYTLSQFVDGDKVLFTMIENGRDRFNENFIGMTSNVMPLVVDCKDQSINSFMEEMANTVNWTLRYSYYPILQLYQKYNFEVHILFQFVPNWITDDFDDLGDFVSEEIVNEVLDSYKDSLTEFFVQIYQNGDHYRLIFTNSNKYSDELIKQFKDTYISVLSKIINSDISSDLNSTLK